MAITNAQQFKQLVNPPMEGKKRPGYRGEAAAASDRAGGRNAGRDTSPAGTGNVGGDFDRGSFQDAVRRGELKAEVERQEKEKKEELLERFRNKRFRGSNFPGFIGMGLNLASPIVQKGMTVNRNFFLDKVLGSKNFKNIDFTSLTPSQQEEVYGDYMSGRLSGETDAYGNPKAQTDGNDAYIFPTSGIMAEAPSDMDQESEIDEDEGADLSRRFRADGGRIGFRGGAAAASDAAAGRDAGRDTSAAGTSDRGDGPATGGGPTTNVGGGVTNITSKKDIPIPNTDFTRFDKNLINFGFIDPTVVDDDENKTITVAGLTKMQKMGLKAKKSNVKRGLMTPQEALDSITPFNDPEDPATLEEVEKYYGLADGGRAGLAEGGMPYEGGIMDLESARQMYGLGKLVKKITRSVKKIAKSPIGKAALLYTVGGGLGSLAKGQGFFSSFMSPMNQITGMGSIFSKSGLQNIASKVGLGAFENVGGNRIFQKNVLGKALTSPTGLIAGASLVSGLLTAEQEEEAQQISDETGIDIAEIRANPNKYLARRFVAEGGRIGLRNGGDDDADDQESSYDDGPLLIPDDADLSPDDFYGRKEREGIMKMASAPTLEDSINEMKEMLARDFFGKPLGNLSDDELLQIDEMLENMSKIEKDSSSIKLAEGGKPEPVAKKTMPLLDMGGKEMDLRAEGGFVPIGRMEKADDVPARLSKNEFVFTAEAVRNAGEGDVDKGAEVMYNMMKNLESGGDVSEESQGLDGARKMFQTSQRLEEVL